MSNKIIFPLTIMFKKKKDQIYWSVRTKKRLHIKREQLKYKKCDKNKLK